MEIKRTEFKLIDIDYPAVEIYSPDNKTNAIVIHGFGGNKEEQLGLSLRISMMGFNTYAIDLRGHGENSRPLDSSVMDDVNAIVDKLREKGKVVTIGHSLGGRLSLLSKADFRIGISPALNKTFSNETMNVINSLRKYRVNELSDGINFSILKDLPLVEESLREDDLILYGTRDVPEIKKRCEELKVKHGRIVEIRNALHNDIFLLEQTFQELRTHLESIAR